jgi:glycerophosphoryl diester phosphodiesterase
MKRLIAVLSMLIGLVVGVLPLQAQAASAPVPYAVAHRCGPTDFGLENAPATCAKAARNVLAVEIDVRDSKSGTPWVMHDWNLATTSNCVGGVIEKTDAQLQRCRLDNGEKVPTLHEMLGTINKANPNTKVFIHYNSGVYSARNIQEIQKRVVWQGFTKKAVYVSWLPGHLKLFKAYAPAVPRLRVLEAGQSWYSDPSATDIMPATPYEITPARVSEAAKRGVRVHGSTGDYGSLLGKSVASNMVNSPLGYFRWLSTH